MMALMNTLRIGSTSLKLALPLSSALNLQKKIQFHMKNRLKHIQKISNQQIKLKIRFLNL